jgi:glycerophosphoryl diester phosphodiesterase
MDCCPALSAAARRLAICLLLVAMPGQVVTAGSEHPIVIAHRGASGYLPEHTLAAKALAHEMGADFLEQDVVLTADDVPVVLHDITLEDTTDVETLFPERRREDGHFYAIDFTLAEIRQLRVHERTNAASGKAVYPGRFPVTATFSGVPTLAEELRFIDGLNRTRTHSAGIYLELKKNWFHRQHGKDLPAAVVAVLAETGWLERPDMAFLQSFEPEVLRRLQEEFAVPLPRIQLIAENSWGESPDVDYSALQTAEGLAGIAGYAQGIGPWLGQIYLGTDESGTPQLSNLVRDAHNAGLLVHPYTFRRDQLPEGIHSFETLLSLFINTVGVDGLFTDFPDEGVAFVRGLP